ncbi:MAG: DNA topoisomerase IV, partial [Thiovulaceae bacterium]|nr:DNA topoisomerase IV [Sulfurimonadaceae bacterium]
EVDDATLLALASESLDDLDSLTDRDLKLAIGEEVEEELLAEQEAEEIAEEMQEEPSAEIAPQEPAHDAEVQTKKESNEGVEALKKLLQALSNEDIAASLKDMKININITIGEK